MSYGEMWRATQKALAWIWKHTTKVFRYPLTLTYRALQLTYINCKFVK